MQGTLRIFVSYADTDEHLAGTLGLHLIQAFPGNELEFWDKADIPPEKYRTLATAFLEKADLFLAVISVHYLDHPDNRWEMEKAVKENRRRPALRMAVALAKSAFVPEMLSGFPVFPDKQDPIEKEGVLVDRQHLRVAMAVRELMQIPPAGKKGGNITLPLEASDLKERMIPYLDRVDFKPVFDQLKDIAQDPTLLKKLFEAEDSFSNLYQQTRGLKTSITAYLTQKSHYRDELRRLIDGIRREDLASGWQHAFIRRYYYFKPVKETFTEPYFYIPTEEIAIPETLHLPVSIGDTAGAENIGLLSYQQKLDFRRNLLLAQDAIAVANFARAHAHSEHVRTHIDPQSAQLYEYLLISYVYKETPEKIIQEALFGEGRMLNYVTLYAGRLRLYQEQNQCVTPTGSYNRRVTAELLSDGMANVYAAWPNDYLLETGRHQETAEAANQDAARKYIEAAQLVYRAIHPMRGALRVLVNELCGGGKFNWIDRLVFAEGEIRFLTRERFDLESQIGEIMELIYAVDAGDPARQFNQQVLLRENLYYSLLGKRQLLAQQVKEEIRTNRRLTDVHQSVIYYVQACLMGYRIFGDAGQDNKEQSFLRLALEYLLPELVLDPDPEVALPQLRWFDLNAEGSLCAHADSAQYKFDARAIIESIIHDHAGKAGWLHVSPNIKTEVYLQYIRDTQEMYDAVCEGLSYSDFRRMNELDARQQLIRCLQRWMVCFRANPENGQDFLDNIIQELTGSGQMLWLYHDPYQLVTHPDSLAFSFDARGALQLCLRLSTRHTEDSLRQAIAGNLFHKRIEPIYTGVKKGDEKQRTLVCRLLLETLTGFRLYQDFTYLDFVFEELTEEIKFPWVDLDIKGHPGTYAFRNELDFKPLEVLESLAGQSFKRYRPYQARERIARNRYRDLMERYLHEISEYKRENRRSEREITIDIIRRLKGVYIYLPQEKFLELPILELSGKGRIRWHANFLGMLPVRENHFENQFYDFNYRYELFDAKRLLDRQYEETQRVLRETGEIEDDGTR